MSKRFRFQKDLEHLLNMHSLENLLDMPDYIMAEMLTDILGTIAQKNNAAREWHGLATNENSKKFEIPPNSVRFATEEETENVQK